MQEVKKPSKTKEMVEHLGHVKYPVTGKEFMAACSNMNDATQERKEWVKKNIAMNKTYKSADEVKKKLSNSKIIKSSLNLSILQFSDKSNSLQ